MNYRFLVIALMALGIAFSGTQAHAAVLSVSPSNLTVTKGAPIVVDLLLDSAGENLSGANVSLTYPDNLKFVALEATDSIFPNELNPLTQETGSLSFTRVRTDAGYTGTEGRVARLTFQTIASGSGTLAINVSKSSVYRQSNSSNALQAAVNGLYTINVAKATTASATVSLAMQLGAILLLLALIVVLVWFIRKRS